MPGGPRRSRSPASPRRLLLGGALAVLLMRSGGFFAPEVQTFHAVLFVGAALSITAFPVLARIIYERGIAGTAMGSLALAAGALDDAAAWVILAIVLGSFTGHGTLAVVAAAGAMLYVAGVFGAIRPMLVRFDAAARGSWRPGRPGCSRPCLRCSRREHGSPISSASTRCSALSCLVRRRRAVSCRASSSRRSSRSPHRCCFRSSSSYSGLNSRIGLLDSAWLWTLTALAFLAACAGKGVACFIAARLTGASTREALSVATLMNARGLMELILLNIGLQRGIITPILFTILVMMTIGTTLMAGPLFSFVNRGEPSRATDSDFRLSETS